MALLSKKDAEEVRKIFQSLSSDVQVKVFTQKLQCPTCGDTEAIMKELEDLSDRLKVSYYNSQTDRQEAKGNGILLAPAITVSDGGHSRVKFYGTPSGYEFSSLLTTIVDQGGSDEPLSTDTQDFLADLDTKLEIKVFVTPTCPHCPSAAVLASRMARFSPAVTSTVIEANEFSDLSLKYSVQGVPRTVINDIFYVEGSLSESMLVKALRKALEKTPETPVNLLNYLEDDE